MGSSQPDSWLVGISYGDLDLHCDLSVNVYVSLTLDLVSLTLLLRMTLVEVKVFHKRFLSVSGPNNTRTCCSAEQLKTMESSLSLPDQLLSRCPTCNRNFRNEICQMTCNPTHSRFLYGNDSAPCPRDEADCKKTGWASVTYFMTEKYANDLYRSCKDVQMPATNSKAMGLLCGQKKGCTPQIWLDYMGSTGNGKAPFPILYVFKNESFELKNTTIYPLNITNIRCNETAANITEPCSCSDCEDSCGVIPPFPKPKEPFTILGLDGISFIMGCIFAVFVIFFGVYIICYNIVVVVNTGKGSSCSVESESQVGSRKSLVSRKQVSPADIGSLEKLGARVEQSLRSIFQVWGRLCASYPIIVLLVTIIVFGSLAGGIARYNVTTDPVKLWSAPESEARRQKDYFDSHFGYVYIFYPHLAESV